MPRAVQTYKKMQNLENQMPHRPLLNFNIMILLLTLAFIFHAGNDAYSIIQKTDPIEQQQAKLCIVEFKKKTCDPLNLTQECQKLLPCIQRHPQNPLNHVSTIMSLLFKEIIEDLPFAVVILGLLVLIELKGKIGQKEIPKFN